MFSCDKRSLGSLISGYQVRRGEAEDVDFLAQSIQDSERAHTGVGIWDVAIGDDTSCPERSLKAILRHACLHDNQSHFHYSHFLVVEPEDSEISLDNKDDATIAAVGCCFLYPEFCVVKSYPGMSRATCLLRSEVCEEESVSMWQKIDIFLDTIFPQYDYDNTWMLESIIVSPQHRKRGLAVALIHALYEEGRKDGRAKECLAVCAIGNTPAYQSYIRAGFECIGDGKSDIAHAAMGYPGFYLFRKLYDRK